MIKFELDLTEDNFNSALDKLKSKSLENIVLLLDNLMKNSFRVFQYPKNCCELASQFGGFILVQLGYEVEAILYPLLSHTLLIVGTDYVDFTVAQYTDTEERIFKADKYSDAIHNDSLDMVIHHTSFDYYKNCNKDFILQVVYKGIYDLINIVNL